MKSSASTLIGIRSNVGTPERRSTGTGVGWASFRPEPSVNIMRDFGGAKM